MVSDRHYLELYINGELMELESQESLGLRINNTIFNPTKTVTTQAEYSYSFSIPSTPHNDKVLDYANNLSKLNKFRARYASQVYADGELIFDGSLTIQKYSAKDKKYTCNLVNIKVNTLEEIFGEETLTSLKWYVPFSGASTIDEINYDTETPYFFPMVAYGVFQKDYVSTDAVGSTYTPKSTIDKYNKWWIESFYPSLNVVETMRKAFESKGYTVAGSAFSDPNIKRLYASCYLASEQTPIYNIGNPKFGDLALNVTWDNFISYGSHDSEITLDDGTTTIQFSTGGYSQDLEFPYEKVRPAINASNNTATEEYNFSNIVIWNMMDSKNNSNVHVTMLHDSYMYDPTESLIVIPADGWYRITLDCSANLSGVGETFTDPQWTTTYYDGDDFTPREVQITKNLNGQTPLEIQLVRNVDGNVELIKGRKNVKYMTGNPNQSTYTYEGGSYAGGTSYTNKIEWETDYPHQDLYGSEAPTKTDGILVKSADRTALLESYGVGNGTETNQQGFGGGGGGSFGGNSGSRRSGSGSRDSSGFDSHSRGNTKYNTLGFMHKSDKVMPYDQAVSPAFICGFSSMGDGTVSVMRNGKSWSKTCSINNKILSNVDGMEVLTKTSGGTVQTADTTYCSNVYNQAPTGSVLSDSSSLSGRVDCCVYLNKNDVLELIAIQRNFDNIEKYATFADCSLRITAMSERSEAELRADTNWGFLSQTEFPTELNLFNFTNKETKISDWISNVQKAFNLEIVMQGNDVQINTNQGYKKNIEYAVNIDDRVSCDEAESEFISYPKSMAVKYKIDTEEYGYELTVPQEHINDEDWAKWGDSGFTIIELNDDSYETQKQETQTNFSYTYYMDFDFKQVYTDGSESSAATKIRMPVIEKSEYMAEGYSYDESMKHDGYSFTQRFWYRDQPMQGYVWLSSVLADGSHETVDITLPMNSWDNFNLSYKATEKSIATEYFNIYPMLSSNFVTVECYLTPQEYKCIKNGALVHYDSDLYYISELSGYDPSGYNKTKLKLIKKI